MFMIVIALNIVVTRNRLVTMLISLNLAFLQLNKRLP